MWESGPWLSVWCSPDGMPWLWLLGLLAALGFRRLGTPRFAASVLRVTALLILLQASVVFVTLLWAASHREAGSGVNDGYVQAARLCFGLELALGIWGVVVLARARELPQLANAGPGNAAPVRRRRLVSGAGIVTVVLLVGLPALAIGAVAAEFLPESSLVTWLLAFVVSALAAACTLIALRVAAARDVWRNLSLALGACALLIFGSLWFHQPPLFGMTDAALLRIFDEQVDNDRRATAAIEELRRRGKSEQSALPSFMAGERHHPSRLSGRIEGALLANNQAGCSVPAIGPVPYAGKPEVDLLSVLIARGQLEVPRAWLHDENVPQELRDDLRLALDGKPYPPARHYGESAP